jgi:polyadenylate-binding protein 2
MKARLAAMEEEAQKLKDEANAIGDDMNTGDGAGAGATDADKAEADSRSVHCGGVDYATTPEELANHFQACGTVNRVTILTDKYDNPKGFAYVEFLEADAVQNAVKLTDTEIHGRKLRVSAKRTNVPGMSQGGMGGRGGRGGFNPYMNPMMMMMNPMMMGFGGRGRGRGRGRGGGRGGRGGRGAPY